ESKDYVQVVSTAQRFSATHFLVSKVNCLLPVNAVRMLLDNPENTDIDILRISQVGQHMIAFHTTDY
ncbi:MAG: hypothetical protein WCQ50_02635, partial [Spirochaetota bacterium]